MGVGDFELFRISVVLSITDQYSPPPPMLFRYSCLCLVEFLSGFGLVNFSLVLFHLKTCSEHR